MKLGEAEVYFLAVFFAQPQNIQKYPDRGSWIFFCNHDIKELQLNYSFNQIKNMPTATFYSDLKETSTAKLE